MVADEKIILTMTEQIKRKAIEEIRRVKDPGQLESIYRKYLGRKGELTMVLRSLGNMSGEERKKEGRAANQAKKELAQIIEEKQRRLSEKGVSVSRGKPWIDITAPGNVSDQGHLHPITLVQRQIEEIFQSMGFAVLDGPEAETEYYNFDALNIPKDHPARDFWDTFWLKDTKTLLRTHTSPMQARYMEKNTPPLRIIVPGRCYRHEATDATHDAQFYQVEGLMVGEDISIAHFKGVVGGFLKKFFGPEAKMRLRPSYFPFTEPSFEIDIKRSHGGWLELMGAGMVHPNVFKEAGYPYGKWQGFAFGVGLDRLAMMKYQIDDIRHFHAGDVRFLKQF